MDTKNLLRRNKLPLLIVFFFYFSTLSSAQIIEFADTNFRNAIINATTVNNNGSKVDKDKDGEISYEEAAAIHSLYMKNGSAIRKTDGLEAFVNLDYLYLSAGTGKMFQYADTLKFDNLPALETLGIYGANEIVMGDLPKLKSLFIEDMYITSLDLSGCDSLEVLHMNNGFTQNAGTYDSLDLSSLQHLQEAKITANDHLKYLNLDGLSKLEDLDLDRLDSLQAINTSSLTSLTILDLSQVGLGLSELDLTHTKLTSLKAYDCNSLVSIDITGLNDLKSINVGACTNLTELKGSNSNQSIGSLSYQDTQLDYLDFKFSLGSISTLRTNGCIPYLPPNVTLLTLRTPELNHCVSNLPNSLWDPNSSTTGYSTDSSQSYDLNICSVTTNIHGCKVFPTIEGNVFIDDNMNDTLEEEEIGFQGVNVMIQPGDYVLSTDEFGHYTVSVEDIGSYTTSIEDIDYYETKSQTVSVEIEENIENMVVDFPLVANAIVNDLAIYIVSTSTPRPGFDMEYNILYKNVGTTTIDNANLKVYLPNYFELNDTTSIPTLEDNVLTYDLTNLIAGSNGTITVAGKITTNTLGEEQTLITSIEDVNDGIEETSENNADTLIYTIIGSYDPNDKLAPAFITSQEVANQTPIDYRIRFQNTGTDTAFTVVVTDTLSDLLDLSTFELIGVSHTVNTILSGNVLSFEFNNILLPDSNVNEPESHGFIYYKISPFKTLVEDDKILNTANIYFDFNFPVITNTTITTVKTPSVVTNVVLEEGIINDVIYPNPATTVLNLSFEHEQGSIKIVDIMGVEQEVVWISPHTISVKELPSGIYYLQQMIGEKLKIIAFRKL